MADAPDERARDPEGRDAPGGDSDPGGDPVEAEGGSSETGAEPAEEGEREGEEVETVEDEGESVETLRRKVEEKYDFENFTPADMAQMTAEEWEAAFDPETWITGPELLDRVEADLRSRVAGRELFAVVERVEVDGEERVLAYTDRGYALVGPDGTVEGEGGILGEVEPIVALCSMDDYDVPEPPEDAALPDPDEVAEGSGELGNRLLLALAATQLLAGLVLLVSPFLLDLGGRGTALLTTVAGLGFLVIGVVLFVLVANARLSDRFRAEEYRRRLRAAGVGTDERPDFLPLDDEER